MVQPIAGFGSNPARSPVSVSDEDLETVARQLGRTPRGVIEVSYRTPDGAPAVVKTAPRLPDGTPFPLSLIHI